MRNQIQFELETENLGKLDIQVYEVSPRILLKELGEIRENPEEGWLPYWGLLKHCVNLTKEQIEELYPNEQAIIIEKFKETNKDFFCLWPPLRKAIDKLGLVDWMIDLIQKTKILGPIKERIVETFKANYKPPSPG